MIERIVLDDYSFSPSSLHETSYLPGIVKMVLVEGVLGARAHLLALIYVPKRQATELVRLSCHTCTGTYLGCVKRDPGHDVMGTVSMELP